MKYNVLLVDDDGGYYENQKSAAVVFEIDLHFINNWNDAKIKLESTPDYYDAVIIDGKGRIYANDIGEDQRMVAKALRWFGEQKVSGKFYNMVVNTGYLKDISKFEDFEGVTVFEKGYETLKLYPHLIDSITNNSENKIKVKYNNIYEIFNDKYLPKADWKIVNKLITKLDKCDFEKKDFNEMRDLLESLFQSANRINNSVFLPNTLLRIDQNNRPIIGYIVKYWTGDTIYKDREVFQKKAPSPIIPEELESLLKATGSLVQAFSHKNNPPNIFLYHTTLYSLFTFILWFKSYVDENYSNNI